MIDINSYIGIPYVSQGRDISGWDCYGLVKSLYKKHRNIDLPDWQVDTSNMTAVCKLMTESRREAISKVSAIEITYPEDWAIVMIDRKLTAHHMGLFLLGGVLHCVEQGCTQWNSWSAFNRLYSSDSVRLFRWQLQ